MNVNIFSYVQDALVRLRAHLKSSLNQGDREKLVKMQAHKFRLLQYVLYRIFLGANLRALATVYNSDKWGEHWYAQHYEKFFLPLRKKKIKLLEIGIGGYSDPELGGGSLRMWRTFFPKGRIHGLDIYDKSPHDESRIKTHKGSQVDEVFLMDLVKNNGPFDIIIDDGSHINEHVISTFKLLFPTLDSNGIYVIEDVQTSYWRSFGGSSTELNGESTSMGFFKSFLDGINHTEYEIDDYAPTYYDLNIVSISFFHNLIFIQKGTNNEKSNVVKGDESLSVAISGISST